MHSFVDYAGIILQRYIGFLKPGADERTNMKWLRPERVSDPNSSS